MKKDFKIFLMGCEGLTLSCFSLLVIDAKTELSEAHVNAASSQFFSSVDIFQHLSLTWKIVPKQRWLDRDTQSIAPNLSPALLTCASDNPLTSGTLMRIGFLRKI